eukprot:10081673-Prorocentrum_lima.AAC.1
MAMVPCHPTTSPTIQHNNCVGRITCSKCGRSHEGVTIYHGPNLISWRSGKQGCTALSSSEAELVGMVA